MKFSLALFACLAAVVSIQAAPVASTDDSLSTLPSESSSSVQPVVSAPSSASSAVPSSASASAVTGATLSSVLKSFNINLPGGLSSSLSNVKLSAMTETQLTQFLKMILTNPNVKLPKDKQVEAIVKQITTQLKNGLHPSANQAANAKAYEDALKNFIKAYQAKNPKDNLLKDLQNILAGSLHPSAKSTPSTAAVKN